jgi:hypothetical protein
LIVTGVSAAAKLDAASIVAPDSMIRLALRMFLSSFPRPSANTVATSVALATSQYSQQSFAPHLSSATSPLIAGLDHSRTVLLGAALIKL